MVAINGTYENGTLLLDKKYLSEKPVKVIITFLDEVEINHTSKFTLADFSFSKSQHVLAMYKGNLSETVLEERKF